MKKIPDFIIVGVSRSGTTSLYEYLDQHPQVCMSSQKETRFFTHKGEKVEHRGPADPYAYNRRVLTSFEEYKEVFTECEPNQLTGEASPVYLYRSEKTARCIYDHVPDVKLVVIFRNPVDRAYSDYLNMVRMGWEKLGNFEEALGREKRRIDSNWSSFYHYKAKGFYANQLRVYFDYFDRSQMKFFLFRDLKENTSLVIRELFDFLGVDPGFEVKATSQHNCSGLPRVRWIHRLLTHPVAVRAMRGPLRTIRTMFRDWNTSYDKPSLDPAIRRKLEEEFRDDIQELETLIDRDLSHWLS